MLKYNDTINRNNIVTKYLIAVREPAPMCVHFINFH